MSKKKAVAPAIATIHTSHTGGPSGGRYEELKRILEDRRREILSEVQSRIKDVRGDSARGVLNTGVVDAEESSVSDIQEDIELALVQMKAETLNRINEALERLEEEKYGRCNDCGEEISQARLRALPFAIRCKDCEEARENAQIRERQISSRRSTMATFLDMSS
jgi:DnaK suppressor protein